MTWNALFYWLRAHYGNFLVSARKKSILAQCDDAKKDEDYFKTCHELKYQIIITMVVMPYSDMICLLPYMFIKKESRKTFTCYVIHTAAIFKDVIHYKVCAKCCQKMAIKIHTSKTFCLVLEAFQVFST